MTAQSYTMSDTLIRRVLRVNAITSMTAGVLLVLMANPIAELFGIGNTVILGAFSGSAFLFIVGLSLLPFAAACWYVSNSVPFETRLAWGITVLDLLWVVSSVLLLLTDALGLSTLGGWAVLIQADIILVFFVLEWIGLRRVQR